jgi:hypothetical protein
MRVTWIHPSWRDVVIEDLAERPRARRRFLGRCELPGAVLALSLAGGPTGERRLPFIRDDRDWDALSDAVHRLARTLDDDGVAALLHALRDASAAGAGEEVRAELDAIAELALATLRRRWGAERQPLDVTALEAWWSLRKAIRAGVEAPDVELTWKALAPRSQIRLADARDVERLQAWLHLVEVLVAHDAAELPRRGWPSDYVERLGAVHALGVHELGHDPAGLRGELLRSLLFALARLAPWLATDVALRRLAADRAAPQDDELPGEAALPRRRVGEQRRIDRILVDL